MAEQRRLAKLGTTMATELETRWSQLGVGDTSALDLGETITPRNFGPERLAERPSAAPITLPTLPHISLVIPGARGPASGPSSGAAGRPASTRSELDVIGVLGEGGMGRVLLARQRSLHRDVAIKVVKEEITDPAALEELLVEGVVTGSLEHPGIVPVHALGLDDAGRPVLVMKRIEGVSWRELLRDDRHPAWARFDAAGDDRLAVHIEILMQVCNALHFAHRKGIVHRDLKPGNVMIGSYGEVYVVDWGIAVRASPAPAEGAPAGPERGPFPVALVGTPAFMAPEMVWGEAHRVDARTDVYLLGAALHAALTGKPRHTGETLYETMFAARASLPYPYGAEVPPELAAICNKATSVEPADRHPSALAFRRALGEYLRHQGSIALGEGAAAQLAEIRAVIAVRSAVDEAVDARRFHRLMTECRFGFMQALRAWKDNAPARAGLGACLEVMIEHEIARQDREGAAALIAELPDPRPDLERRLADLDAELGSRRERDRRLRRMEREHDPSVGARPRVVLMGVITTCALAIAVGAMLYGPRRIGHRELIVMMVVVNAVVVPAIALGRRRLFGTLVGRMAAGATLVWAASTLGHRLLAARFGLPVEESLVFEMWATTALLAATSLALPRGFWWSAGVGAASAIAASARPDLAIPIYAGSGVLVSATLLFFGYRMIK